MQRTTSNVARMRLSARAAGLGLSRWAFEIQASPADVAESIVVMHDSSIYVFQRRELCECLLQCCDLFLGCEDLTIIVDALESFPILPYCQHYSHLFQKVACRLGLPPDAQP